MPELILAQVPNDVSIGGYAAITVAYLILVVLVTLTSRTHDVRLVALGLLTAVAAVGYSGMILGPAVVVTPGLMKIAFLLILGGIVVRLLGSGGTSTDSAAESGREVPHE
jgi:hypothetical protein